MEGRFRAQEGRVQKISEDAGSKMGGVTEDSGSKSMQGLGRGRDKHSKTECSKAPKVHTSFRINPVAEIFSKMNAEKEEILKEIGLHGLTNLPREEHTSNKSFDWQFAFWLLKQLDSETGSLDLGVRGRLQIRCEDVEIVIGIPCSGVQLKKSNPLLIQTSKNQVKEGLMLGPEDELNLENILRVLEREVTADKDGLHRRAFIMAAYIFAVSYFLAPKGRPAKVNNEILECILDTAEVKNINWASYVLMSLREASAKLKKELMAKTKSVTLDGCLLLLQVVYLDNLDFGISSTRHDVIPRIKDFSLDKLHDLINADKQKIVGSGIPRFGVRQMRPDEDTLYTRGDLYRSILISKQQIAGGVFLDTDKKKVMDYMKRNIEEGKRRVLIASKQFEENASNIIDECHHNIAALVDIWLDGRVISVGTTSTSEKNGGRVIGAQVREGQVNDACEHGNINKRKYKTMSRRPSKVQKVDKGNNDSAEKGKESGEKIESANVSTVL